jgi:hypothetical protein
MRGKCYTIGGSETFNGVKKMKLEKSLSPAEFAESVDKSVGRIHQLLTQGRVSDAVFRNGRWFISPTAKIIPGKRGPKPRGAKS